VIEVLVCVLIAACFGQLVKTRKNHKNNLVQKMFKTILTLWRLGGFGDFRKKNRSFRLPYQRPSASADCARELFNGSNGSASLVDCTRKKIFCLGGVVFL